MPARKSGLDSEHYHRHRLADILVVVIVVVALLLRAHHNPSARRSFTVTPLTTEEALTLTHTHQGKGRGAACGKTEVEGQGRRGRGRVAAEETQKGKETSRVAPDPPPSRDPPLLLLFSPLPFCRVHCTPSSSLVLRLPLTTQFFHRLAATKGRSGRAGHAALTDAARARVEEDRT